MLSISKTINKILVPLICFTFLWVLPVSGAEEKERYGVVQSAYLNVRLKPDRYSTPIQILRKGLKVRVLKFTSDGWILISYDKQKGYVRNREKYIRVEGGNSPLTSKKAEKSSDKQKPRERKSIRIHKKKAAVIDRKIESGIKEIREISEEERTIINGLFDIDRELDSSKKKVRSIKPQLDRINEEIKMANKALSSVSRDIRKNEAYIKKRLVALYKLNNIGKMEVIASAGSIYDIVSRKNAIEKILATDEDILKKHVENRSWLKNLRGKLESNRKEKQALQEEYKSHVRVMILKKNKKRRVLSEIKRKKKLKLAAVESLKESAKELDSKIKNLGTEAKRSDKKKPNYSRSFSHLKGKLVKPVHGKITSKFGTSKNSGSNIITFQSGVKIKSDRGEPVKSVSSGTVLFADWFKSYGNLVIVDHGESYYTLYAHNEELFKSKGDEVESGEVIATVGESGSMSGPVLHFEIRHHGKPLNPIPWFNRKNRS